MFFQWVMAIGIWCSGVIINIYRGNPTFHPLAMLGGFFWATGFLFMFSLFILLGNVMTVTIVRLIGLGLGSLIWGLSSLVTILPFILNGNS